MNISMLMCLDRRQRLAFILGEVMGEDSETSRARHDLYQFMNQKCGLMNQANPCRCARKASGFMRHGWLDPTDLQFTKDRVWSVQNTAPEHLRELEGLGREHAALYREQPMLTGPDIVSRLRELLEKSGFAKN